MEAGDLLISQIYGNIYYFQVLFEHFRVLGRKVSGRCKKCKFC